MKKWLNNMLCRLGFHAFEIDYNDIVDYGEYFVVHGECSHCHKSYRKVYH